MLAPWLGTSESLSQCLRVPLQPLGRIHGAAVLDELGGETVDSDLHQRRPQKKIERSRMNAPIHNSTIGRKGLTFSASCDSSVAMAPPK
jgi:hypothetical protein